MNKPLVKCNGDGCENGMIFTQWDVCWPSQFSFGFPVQSKEPCEKCQGEGWITEDEL